MLQSSILALHVCAFALGGAAGDPPVLTKSEKEAVERDLSLGDMVFSNVLVLDAPGPIELLFERKLGAEPLALTLRPADSIRLSDGLRLDAGFLRTGPDADPSLRAPLLSSVRARGGETLERGTSVDYFELSLSQNVFSAGPLSLALLGGVQGAAVDTPTGTEPMPPMTATPIAGGELMLALPGGVQIAGRGVVGPRLGGMSGYDVGLSLATRWRLNSRATLEVEYQFVRSAVQAEAFDGELRRESVLVEFKLAF
ncbi:MAG: hypothetical protein ACT4PL_06260 [Phycisphaerales bacterium]